MECARHKIRNSLSFFVPILVVASLATFSNFHIFPWRLVHYDYQGYINVLAKKKDERSPTEGIIATVPRNGCVPRSG